jgi:hypothetical protein
MNTYRVTELLPDGKPGESIGVLDVEQTPVSETDLETISAYFYGSRPRPKILIELHLDQDSHGRKHEVPDYVNGSGTKFWIFRRFS